MAKITAEEKELLKKTTFITDEKIDADDLDDESRLALKEIRSINTYLKKNYPSYDLELFPGYLKKGTARDYDYFAFKERGMDIDEYYGEVRIWEDNGILTLKDNQYANVIKGYATDYIREILDSAKAPYIEVTVTFSSFVGDGVGEKLLFREVLSGKTDIISHIKIALDGSKIDDGHYESYCEKLGAALKDAGVASEVFMLVYKSAHKTRVTDRLYTATF